MSEKQRVNIEKLAELSMLVLSEEEKAGFSKDIEKIIRFYEELNDAKITTESLSDNENELKNIFREDVVTNSDFREALLRNSPTNDGRYVSVPKVIGGGEE